MPPMNPLTEDNLDALANFKPLLTYGQAVQAPPEDFIPAHVGFDKKVLLFDAYFKQTVHESPSQFYTVRSVKIYYYLEDDSISVVEPVIENRYDIVCFLLCFVVLSLNTVQFLKHVFFK